MGISIVVGGQFGSEGKGKISYWWTKGHNIAACVRPGGPNPGHTVVTDEGKYVLRMLPVGCLVDDSICAILPAGSYIDIDVLMEEIKFTRRTSKNLVIDPNAVVIRSESKNVETELGLREEIASTMSGTGGAVMRRISRQLDPYSGYEFAHANRQLGDYVYDTKVLLHEMLDKKKDILIEGTHGYGLSILHSQYYPYCTSRDTTAAGFLSETGLSPFDVDNIIMAIRSYPIRVDGNSGILRNEITWDNLTELSGANEPINEYTSVTKALRRVAYFDETIVNEAIRSNRPNVIVLNHADYFDYSMHDRNECSELQMDHIINIEKLIDAKIDYIGNGANSIFRFR